MIPTVDLRDPDADIDAVWFPPNVWPSEVPELHATAARYLAAMAALSRDLLELCAAALGLPRHTLAALAAHPTWTFELDPDALVTLLAPPIGRRRDLRPVVSAPFLRERLDAISVG